MPLSSGSRRGSYEILSLLGAGGMGEVYLARDTRLGRNVALKVLPEIFSKDAERMARFEREAQVLASLNHPNIAILYGLEESDGVRALVMELVEGPTLADRLLAGPVPLTEAIAIASQIAEALEAAHERGIVHRDLKPANIKVREDGAVKVLDFGLAKALEDSPTAGEIHNSPTLSLAASRVGLILGTAAYMAPEQAAGKPVDRRADIWSFGVVLWEMLTGARLFQGETVPHTLADVLRAEVEYSKLPAETPQAIRGLLRRCLERDARTRLRDIGEARIVLAGPVAEAPVPVVAAPAPQRRPLAWMAAAGAAVLIAVVVSFIHFRESPPPAPEAVRFTVAPPENGTVDTFSLSPDGRYLAIAASVGGRSSLWLRSLDTLDLRPLAGTQDGIGPFWSPDSRYIGFFAENRLKKVAVQGGPPQTLCDALAPNRVGTWNREGIIVFSALGGGLLKVSAAGGVPEPATKQEATNGGNHRYPAFLPDGRHFLFVTQAAQGDKNGIYIASLDSLEIRRLLGDVSNPAFIPGSSNQTGHLLFVREGTLMAQPFDPAGLRLAGELFPVAEQIRVAANNVWSFSVSSAGALAYESGSITGGRKELVWFDREGKRLSAVGEPANYGNLALSPDGKHLAIERLDRANNDIWLLELARGTASRFTFDPGNDELPTWSPDGSRIAYTGYRERGRYLFSKPTAGAGQEEPLLKPEITAFGINDWSADGRWIVYNMVSAKTRSDLWLLPLFGDRKPVPFAQTEFAERDGRFSPDGHYLAYESDETGRPEVYVQPFPSSGRKWQISNGGGRQPEWRRDGKEVFYLAPDLNLMATPVTVGSTLQAGAPRALFQTRVMFPRPLAIRLYAVSGDGRRFLINTELEAAAASPITVVLNWQAAVKK